MPALQGYAELIRDIPRIGVGIAKGGLGLTKEVGKAAIDLGETAFSTAKLTAGLGLSAAKHIIKSPLYLAKGLGNAYHYGRQGAATVNGGMDKLKKSPMPVRLAALAGGLWAVNKMDEAAQRVAEGRRMAEQFKSASAEDYPPNIPADTSSPSSNSPEDYQDYYDYQEWAATKGNNYPERNEAEQNYFDNPHKGVNTAGKTNLDPSKTASVLGLDTETLRISDLVSSTNTYKTAADMSVLPESFADLKLRRGSIILGAAAAAAPVAIATAYINPNIYDGGNHSWDRPYLH